MKGTNYAHRRFPTRIFDDAASHYERVIGLMSFGTGAWYRRDALRRAGLAEGMQLLDVAVGTGAVARAAAGIVGLTGTVLGLDPSMGMLSQARKMTRIPLIQGVAEGLPFRDGTFDFLSMGYARIAPWIARLLTGSGEAQLLMHYCWDTLEKDLAPAAMVLGVITECGFQEAIRTTRFGLLSEYLTRKPKIAG